MSGDGLWVVLQMLNYAMQRSALVVMPLANKASGAPTARRRSTRALGRLLRDAQHDTLCA